MSKSAIERLIEFHDYLKSTGYGGRNKFEKAIGKSEGYLSGALKKRSSIGSDVLLEIRTMFPELDMDWLVSGEGEMLKADLENSGKTLRTIETRPRISLNAAAGTISTALNGVKTEDAEDIPMVIAFSNYSYSLIVKGDSMEPEFHSGDEIACLQVLQSQFIQWGRYHVLDTSQGIVVKRIYDDGNSILCKSEASDLYKDFKIPKKDIYNIALIVGLLRRY
ncbi:MAG: S24 family peptidase [Dysgonomonas sp.]|nr:S24 family peptidase [Dysgonomonas sp.]